mgnify:CR=1 FL=1
MVLLHLLGKEIVVHSSEDFPYEIIRAKRTGYSTKDKSIETLQAKLSIMLEVVRKRPS